MWRGGDGAGPCLLVDEGLQEEGFPCTPAKGWARTWPFPPGEGLAPGQGIAAPASMGGMGEKLGLLQRDTCFILFFSQGSRH